MPRGKKKLPRDPTATGLLKRVRDRHKGYQTHGRTHLEFARAVKRGEALADQQTFILLTGTSVIAHLGVRSTRPEWGRARSRLRDNYATDLATVRDLKRVKCQPSPPLSARDLARTVVVATRTFRLAIDASSTATSMGRRQRDAARRKAWRELDEVLSGVALAYVALDNNDMDLTAVAAGSLK